MAKTLKEIRSLQDVAADPSFKQFEKQYRLVREFGIKALRSALEIERKRQGLGTAATIDSVVDAVLGQALSRIDAYMDQRVNDLSLDNVRKATSLANTPRADYTPEATNKNILQKDVSAEMQRQLQMPSWAKKIDLAADPKINNAIRKIMNMDKPTRGAITTQLNNAMDRMENELRNQLKLRMAARLTPKARYKPY